MQKYHATERDLFLLQQPAINALLPINLSSEKKLEKINLSCRDCQSPIANELFTGIVTTHFSSVIIIEAIAVCRPCKSVTRINYRLYNDGREAYLTEAGWIEGKIKKLSFIAKLKINVIAAINSVITILSKK